MKKKIIIKVLMLVTTICIFTSCTSYTTERKVQADEPQYLKKCGQ